MASDRLESFSRVEFLGVPVEAHECVGSTNDEAFRRAREGAPEGLVIIALGQTAGRGRHGRTWFGVPGQSLHFSMLLRPPLPLPSYPLLSLALACSIADAGSAAIGRSAVLEIKWPNDVLHQGRKLCGVLAESRVLGLGESPVLVLGAGVNVNQEADDFPLELRGTATSLRVAAQGREFTLAGILRASLEGFEPYLATARAGDAAALFTAVRPRLPAPGAPVRVRLGARAVEGWVEEVLETGALRVRHRESGDVETVAAGFLE